MTDSVAVPLAPILAPAPTPPPWKDWWPAIGVLIVLIGSIATVGSYIGQVKDNTRRIDRIEEKLEPLDARMARIETKLDLIIQLREPDSRTTERQP